MLYSVSWYLWQLTEVIWYCVLMITSQCEKQNVKIINKLTHSEVLEMGSTLTRHVICWHKIWTDIDIFSPSLSLYIRNVHQTEDYLRRLATPHRLSYSPPCIGRAELVSSLINDGEKERRLRLAGWLPSSCVLPPLQYVMWRPPAHQVRSDISSRFLL